MRKVELLSYREEMQDAVSSQTVLVDPRTQKTIATAELDDYEINVEGEPLFVMGTPPKKKSKPSVARVGALTLHHAPKHNIMPFDLVTIVEKEDGTINKITFGGAELLTKGEFDIREIDIDHNSRLTWLARSHEKVTV